MIFFKISDKTSSATKLQKSGGKTGAGVQPWVWPSVSENLIYHSRCLAWVVQPWVWPSVSKNLSGADSSVELSAKPVFNYRVQTTVTDLNGESHDAETTLHVGYRNIIVRLKDVEPSVRELQMVKVDLTDINNTPQQGRVEVSIERLQRPAPMRLTPSVLKLGMHQTLDSADYRRRFPQYIYDIKENNRQQWAAEWRWTGVAAEGKLAMPPLQGGIYRIVAFALDGRDTVADTVYTVLAPAADHHSRTDEVLWADQDKATAQPGERVVFRVGSAFKDVKAFIVGDGSMKAEEFFRCSQ